MYLRVPTWRPKGVIVCSCEIWIALEMLEMSEPWDTSQEKLLTESGTSPKKRIDLQSANLKGFGDVKNVLTLDIEMQILEFVQLVMGLALVQDFLSMLAFENLYFVS